MFRYRSIFSFLLNWMCLLILIGSAIYLAFTWNNIPSKIPAHYNAAGEIDRWGNKIELLILPAIGWIVYIGLSIVERFPQTWNTGVTVTAENRDRIYSVMANMLVTLKAITTSIFVFLTINSALAKPLSFWFLPITLILTFGAIIFYVIMLFRSR